MRIAIFLQLVWVVGSIFWNLSGFDMMEESGQGLISPEPSVGAMLILAAIGVLLLVSFGFKFRMVFRLISLVTAAFAGYNLYRAFSNEPELWLNSSWQWGNAAFGLFGIIAGLVGVFGSDYSKGYRPDPISPEFIDNRAGQ